MPVTEDDLNSTQAVTHGQAVFSFKDATSRTVEALLAYPAFFEDPAHIARKDAVRQALYLRFGINGAGTIYENARENKGQPFSVLKLHNCTFGRQAKRNKQAFLDTIDALIAAGGNIVLKNIKAGYLVRIY